MRSIRPFVVAAALAACTGAAAQSTLPAPEPVKPAPKAAAPAKPKKPAKPVTAEAKKKADARKKSNAKKKPDAKPQQAPKVYSTGPRQLRDKDGNVIPTSPDAYNVDSAMPPKPRK